MSETLEVENHQLVLISGESGTGKSASLMNIRGQARWLYLNCEAGKRLPFKNNFDTYRITDPLQVYEAFDFGTDNPDVDGIVIDTVTFLMDMYESQYVLNSTNTQKAWGDYAQFFKNLMQVYVTRFKKPTIILGHTRGELNESLNIIEKSVPVKGSLKGNGIEAYFSTVVSTKRLELKRLKDYGNPMLKVTSEDEALGYKHVFQTRPTKETVGERIRGPIGLFSRQETFIDNDAQLLLDHLQAYYA